MATGAIPGTTHRGTILTIIIHHTGAGDIITITIRRTIGTGQAITMVTQLMAAGPAHRLTIIGIQALLLTAELNKPLLLQDAQVVQVGFLPAEVQATDVYKWFSKVVTELKVQAPLPEYQAIEEALQPAVAA